MFQLVFCISTLCLCVCALLHVHYLSIRLCGCLCVQVCVLPADCCSSVVYSSLWIARVYMLKGYINHWIGGKNRWAWSNTDVSLNSECICEMSERDKRWVRGRGQWEKKLIFSRFIVHIEPARHSLKTRQAPSTPPPFNPTHWESPAVHIN